MGGLKNVGRLAGETMSRSALASGARGGTGSTVFDIVLSPAVFDREETSSASSAHTETDTSFTFLRTLVAGGSIKVVAMNTAETLIKIAGTAVEARRGEALQTLLSSDVGTGPY